MIYFTGKVVFLIWTLLFLGFQEKYDEALSQLEEGLKVCSLENMTKTALERLKIGLEINNKTFKYTIPLKVSLVWFFLMISLVHSFIVASPSMLYLVSEGEGVMSPLWWQYCLQSSDCLMRLPHVIFFLRRKGNHHGYPAE